MLDFFFCPEENGLGSRLRHGERRISLFVLHLVLGAAVTVVYQEEKHLLLVGILGQSRAHHFHLEVPSHCLAAKIICGFFLMNSSNNSFVAPWQQASLMVQFMDLLWHCNKHSVVVKGPARVQTFCHFGVSHTLANVEPAPHWFQNLGGGGGHGQERGRGISRWGSEQ